MNIVMPGMNGYVLKKNIEEMAPGIKALLLHYFGDSPPSSFSGMGMNLMIES
jgi:hypothetical protein